MQLRHERATFLVDSTYELDGLLHCSHFIPGCAATLKVGDGFALLWGG
jgi:hypothetical protein